MDGRLLRVAEGLLRETRSGGSFSVEAVSEFSRIPLEDTCILLARLASLLGLDLDSSKLGFEDRFKVFLFLVRFSSKSLEDASSLLGWREFEKFSSFVLTCLGFEVFESFRFSCGGRRWEVDVLGFREPFVLALDCKCLRRGYRYTVGRAVDLHLRRVEALASTVRSRFKSLVSGWRRVLVTPILVTLKRSGFKVYRGVPVVPIGSLRGFAESDLHVLALEGRIVYFEV